VNIPAKFEVHSLPVPEIIVIAVLGWGKDGRKVTMETYRRRLSIISTGTASGGASQGRQRRSEWGLGRGHPLPQPTMGLGLWVSVVSSLCQQGPGAANAFW